jgi:hypothetical protein
MNTKPRYRTINVSHELHTALKVYCANQGLTMATLVQEVLWKGLASLEASNAVALSAGEFAPVGGFAKLAADLEADVSAGRASAETVDDPPMPSMPRAGEGPGLDESGGTF